MAVKNGKGRGRSMEGLSREEATVQFARSGYNLDEHPAHLIRRVHQRATQHFQQVMEGDNVSPTQFAALATILKNGAISQNHLGRLTSMDPSTISVVVRKLLSENLVERVKSETDQRLYTLERLKKSTEVGKRLLAPLTATEQAQLMSLLMRLCYDDPAETAGGWDNAPARNGAVNALF